MVQPPRCPLSFGGTKGGGSGGQHPYVKGRPGGVVSSGAYILPLDIKRGRVVAKHPY